MPTNEKIANKIRKAVDELNKILKIAQDAGLVVSIHGSGVGSDSVRLNQNTNLGVGQIYSKTIL